MGDSAWLMLAGYARTRLAAGAALVGLGFHRAEPFAVHFFVCIGEAPTVCWVFARELLIDGLVGDVGIGDVGVRPGADGRLIVRLGAWPAAILIEVPAAAVAGFVEETLAVVPAGAESRRPPDGAGTPAEGGTREMGQVACEVTDSASASRTTTSASSATSEDSGDAGDDPGVDGGSDRSTG